MEIVNFKNYPAFPLIMGQDTIKVETDATSANLGPWYDRGGAKLKGLSLVTIGEKALGNGLIIKSEGKYPVPTDESNLAYRVAGKMFEDYGIKDGLSLKFINNIKSGGLGTSGAGAVAVVEVINYLYDLKLSDQQKIKYAALGEPGNHLDNVVPCVVGGIVLSSRLEGEELPKYLKLNAPTNVVPAVVIPLGIIKEGGTAKAKEALESLRLTNPELVYASSLAESMIAGFIGDDFESIRESIAAYSLWPKSVTWVRNSAGVYKINVRSFNFGLERLVGKEAIVTPSGAGPAMLILARYPDVAKRASDLVVKIYQAQGYEAIGMVTSFNNEPSRIIQ